MARISINKASIDFKTTRNTLYKYIKQGKLTRDSDGKIDTADMVRLFGGKQSLQQNEQLSIQLDEQQTVQNTQNIQLLIVENEKLKQQLSAYEIRINDLIQQLAYVKQNEAWMKNQLQQKLIEHKPKLGLLRKFFTT